MEKRKVIYDFKNGSHHLRGQYCDANVFLQFIFDFELLPLFYYDRAND